MTPARKTTSRDDTQPRRTTKRRGVVAKGNRGRRVPASPDAARLYADLSRSYPDAHCALHHSNAFELLVATILSAQCTDERVNKVTPVLFKRFPTIRCMADATQDEMEEVIHSTGFYRNKARNIRNTARIILDEFSGEVPRTMDELLRLPGVARKTANVVLGNAFGKNEGVVVDTHVSRLSQRLGLTRNTDPVKIERDLASLFSREQWTMLSHLLIHHGRAVCEARKPRCNRCPLSVYCPKSGVDPRWLDTMKQQEPSEQARRT